MKNKIRFLGLILACCVLVLGLVGCGKSKDVSDDTSDNSDTQTKQEIVLEEDVKTSGEENKNDEIFTHSQTVSKPELGMEMDLSGEYADSTIADLTEEELNLISNSSLGGFKIVKEISGSSYVLANIAVINSSEIQTPENRAKYPLIFQGGEYSIVATLPALDNSNSEGYEKAVQLQSGMVQQLCTISYDEKALTYPVAEEEPEINTEISDTTEEVAPSN